MIPTHIDITPCDREPSRRIGDLACAPTRLVKDSG